MAQSNEHVFDKYASAETLAKIVDYKNVSQMWEESVKNYPDDIAIVDGESVSYRALNDAVSNFRGVLQNKGVRKEIA